MRDILPDEEHEKNKVMASQVIGELADAMFHVKRALEQLQSRGFLEKLGVSRDAKRYSQVHLSVLRTLSVLGGSFGAMLDTTQSLLNAVILARGDGDIDRPRSPSPFSNPPVTHD